MQFEFYDYITGNPLGFSTSLNYSDLIQNQHCPKPTVLRGYSTDTITGFKLFLEDKGLSKDCQFGFFSSLDFIPSIQAGSNRLTDNVYSLIPPYDQLSGHLIEVPNATITSDKGAFIPWGSDNYSYYLWLDIQSPKTGLIEANFRIFY